MELAVHEALLLSRHRTLDPEAADFFFVPVYGGCYISRFFRPTPAHSLFVPSEERPTWLPAPVLGNQFYRRALQWVQASTLRPHHRTSHCAPPSPSATPSPSPSAAPRRRTTRTGRGATAPTTSSS